MKKTQFKRSKIQVNTILDLLITYFASFRMGFFKKLLQTFSTSKDLITFINTNHYVLTISKGLIDSRSLVYFFSFIRLFSFGFEQLDFRKKYQEFLKIDFPRVPYPEDKEKFKKLVKLGSQLRETHLLQGKNFGGRQNFITNYDIQENNLVEKIYFDLAENSSELGRVYINKTQYFGKVPKVAWDFFIGGYQPAQKWLKDRKDRTLSSDDIEQYQKIILALKTTSNIMPQIDPILFS